ncbi:ubiquitin-like-specific protease 1D isoform X2 [Mangifera indica]|uniref:ubiquitin-like-specific protease 1D isoform X2 n=1 Tax=Mangifera indica TaxID=29780 RepID=UPI001CFAFE71|nr:ubiquitin-like-specific protease 1D isoform X2 [Mangifera indica]
MEEQEENRHKRKLDIDWEEVFPTGNDEPPADLIVKKEEPPAAPPKSRILSGFSDDSLAGDEFYQQITDHELEARISSMKKTYEDLNRTLPDKGRKILDKIKRLEDEKQRRRLRPAEMDVDRFEKSSKLTSTGASDGFRPGTTSSEVQLQCSFATVFSEKMEEKRDSMVVKAFDKELSTLGHCGHQKMRANRQLSQRERKDQSSSRQFPVESPSSFSCKIDKPVYSNGDHKGRASSTYSSHHTGDKLSNCFPNRKDAIEVPPSNISKYMKGRTLVLLDEDETEDSTVETLYVETTKQADKLAECDRDAKIDYPSRDDPESVEICYKDIDHLAPEAYLTSSIMNFYIRYLQQQASPTNRAIWDCHFFNTYFYQKLKEAVSRTGGEKDSFIKFRRWWKGINIFQKAYIFIPIHEDLHWSLVIICIPDKEDESGPNVLHLDSLSLHSSRSIFDNIRSFLKEEWNLLYQEVTPADIPIPERIWKCLPRRIDARKIKVPQQKNDYDCGLFVLYFMKRFIEEVPERLKKKDLEMFGTRWFRPEEASGLRVEIRNLIKKEFQLARKSCRHLKSSSSSGRCQETVHVSIPELNTISM